MKTAKKTKKKKRKKMMNIKMKRTAKSLFLMVIKTHHKNLKL
jgi:hypothetical protein